MRKKILLLFCFLVGSFGSLLIADDQKLIVVRHGEAESNALNIYNTNPENPAYKAMDLTEKGRQQAQQTAKELLSQGFNDKNITVVFVSPLPRSRQTAEELERADLFSKDKMRIDNRLTETQAGDLEGKQQLPQWTSEVAKEHGGETEDQVKARMLQFYQSLLKEYPQGNIIVVTHALAGQSLIAIAANKQVKLALGEAAVVPLRGNNQ